VAKNKGKRFFSTFVMAHGEDATSPQEGMKNSLSLAFALLRLR
jgi:hypothetical protein